MTLSILARGAKAPANAPVFGHLMHTDNMKVCVRATSSQNFFDLSDDERNLTIQDQVLINQNGLNCKGGAGKGGVKVSELFGSDFNEFTIMGVLKTNSLGGSNQALNLWLLGDFYTTGVYTGIGLLLRTQYNAGTGTWSASVRGTFGGRNKTTGANSATFLDAFISENVASGETVPTFNYPNMFVALRQKIVDGVAQLTVKILSHNKTTTGGSSSNDYSGSAKKLVLAAAGRAEEPLKIGGSYTAVSSDSTDHTAVIKEVRFDSVALTDQQIEDQYQATKKWLKAEGTVNVDTWI